MRLGAGGEGGDLLVPDMHPFDLALPTNRIRQAVQAIAHYAVYSLNTSRGEGFCELISNSLCHDRSLLS
jgi:hypothetical protein